MIFGTKCNKLMVYDVNMQRLKQIPTLERSRCAVEINPSRTLFAAMARHSNDIQIYRLPTLSEFNWENGHGYGHMLDFKIIF